MSRMQFVLVNSPGRLKNSVQYAVLTADCSYNTREDGASAGVNYIQTLGVLRSLICLLVF